MNGKQRAWVGVSFIGLSKYPHTTAFLLLVFFAFVPLRIRMRHSTVVSLKFIINSSITIVTLGPFNMHLYPPLLEDFDVQYGKTIIRRRI